MELAAEMDAPLQDYLGKCRCCFRMLIDESKSLGITENIKKSFFELTQLELIQSELLSSKICWLCNNDIEVFSTFRKDLIQKQERLYQAIDASKHRKLCLTAITENQMTPIKTESDVFINCEGSVDSIPPQIVIKSENEHDFDIESLSPFNMSLKTKISPKNKLICIERRQQIQNNPIEKNNEKKKVICPTCGSLVRELSRHIQKVHLNIRNHWCDICEHGTYFKCDMEVHMRTHLKKTSTITSTTYFCECCGKNFPKRHLLNRHIKLKHTEKQRKHTCHTCSKFSALKKHVESHSDKIMPCEYCGKLFSCMNNLRTHLYYHSEPKFECRYNDCGKKFFMKKLLVAHLNVHQGKKDFGCPHCDKSYFFQSHLKRHILSMHMRLKIACEVGGCSSNFARKETYRNHVISHHQNIGPEASKLLLEKIKNMTVDDYKQWAKT